MINKDIEKLFGNSIDELVRVAKQKWAEAMDKIEQEQQYKKECKDSRDSLSDALNRINEVMNYDLTTKEGYSEYMKYLADLRIRSAQYNNVLKTFCGKTAEELIDEIAQKATDFYNENNPVKPVKEEEQTFKEDHTDNKSKEFYEGDDTKEDTCDEDEKECQNPSDLVSDSILESINRIIDRYVNESLIPNYGGRLRQDDLDWLTDELVEFACWLNTQYPNK